MFKEGVFINPHDQRHYDEEQRVEKLHNIVDMNTEYFVDEIELDLDDYLDIILEEAISVNISYIDEYEREYVKDEIIKKIKNEYKLDLGRK